MTFQEFFNKWNGKACDYDFAYGNQCVDLYDMYCKEVVNAPIFLVAGAKNIWDNYPTDYFDRILNTPEAVPQKGDVIIWTTGTWGHVAIFNEGDVNRFTSFDQNYPEGSLCHLQEHNYTGVVGWLRPKTPAEKYYLGIDLTNIESVKVCVQMWDAVVNQKLYVSFDKYNKDISTQKSIYENQLGEKGKEIDALKAQIEKLNLAHDDLNRQLEGLDRVVLDLQTKLTEALADKPPVCEPTEVIKEIPKSYSVSLAKFLGDMADLVERQFKK